MVPSLGDLSIKDALEASSDMAHRHYLQLVLRRFHGSVPQAADHAGIERESFYRLMRRHGIVAEHFRKVEDPEG